MINMRFFGLSLALLSLCVVHGNLSAQEGESKLPEPRSALPQVLIHINQVAYDATAPKYAIVESADELPVASTVEIRSDVGSAQAYLAPLGDVQKIDEWFPGRHFYRVDFSPLTTSGKYYAQLEVGSQRWKSPSFFVSEMAVAELSFPAVTAFFKHQRASTPQEINADQHLLLFGSDKRVDLHGGWCDASGDISKYFSHLAYTNFMTPQQTPLVVWAMVNAVDTAGPVLQKLKTKDALQEEALYGADYLRRSLAPEGFFYMTVFSYFKKDPEERRVVGLLADSKTTSDYQSAYREGAGLAIAALARISRWNINRDFTASEYLYTAERAFAHLEANNLKYDDDGKENIIDDYGALMGATELWIATDKPTYHDAACKRAQNLIRRVSDAGYFIADDGDRPFWHAADAGLPIIALVRYLDKESDSQMRTATLAAIKKALDYQLTVTAAVDNPFGYPRQAFKLNGNIKEGFFIPHENESGWWWQGENARLSSLATAAILGGRLVYPGEGPYGVSPELTRFVSNQMSWILGGNPYDICFMYQFGQNNVPHMDSMFGHGSGRGGISNGITGKDGSADGSGIDFRFHANGNEWRWTEQWIPHSAWYLQAVTAMSTNPKSPTK
jgi:hypothetical protein